MNKRKREQLIRRLKRVKEKYSENYDELVYYHDKKDEVCLSKYKRLIRTERELNNKEIEIKKDLGIYCHDVCSINIDRMCWNCTGYYKRLPVRTIRSAFTECMKGDEGAIKCTIR